MQEPLQISHNMAPSDALERRVREQWAKVERHYDGIISARIAIEAPHKQPHKSTLGISISIGVPGRDIVVRREQRLHESDDHATWVINEVFAPPSGSSRTTRSSAAKSPHEGEREYARIARLHPEEGYSFLETARSSQHLLPSGRGARRRFRRSEDAAVRSTPCARRGPMGPMASSVWTLGSDHPIR